MSGVDPITVERLRAFGRRRRRLIAVRGVCASAAGLVGSLLAIAMLDRLLVLPDAVRWVLSVVAYALAGAVVWVMWLRLVLRAPSREQLARLLEKASPDLREDLISAIELGEYAAGEGEHGSPVFRGLLQRDVAARIGRVDVESLLPLRRIAGWVWASLAIGLLCVGLGLIPGLSFGRLMLRALAPGANVGRVSSVQVRILEPSPSDGPVAVGESVAVVVELSGPVVGSAKLETWQSGKGRERSSMSRRDSRVFAGEIATDRQVIQYRVHAGDAVTAWHELRPHTPPYVTGFIKTFSYPKYTRYASVTRHENDGSVEAIEGSTVELVVEPDQPCTGELRIRSGNEAEQTMVLSRDGENRLHGRLSVQSSGTYQVRLVSLGTTLESKFSPRYPIKAQVDAPPRATILAPDNGALLQPDDVVKLIGRAEDDIGLKRVEQWVQVNGVGPWQKVVLASEVGRQTPIAASWDLLKLNLQGGDLVVTKMVAVDSKGSQSESAPLQIMVNFRDLKANRFETLEAKRQALTALDKLLATLEEQAPVLKTALTNAIANTGDLAKLQAGLQEPQDRLEQMSADGSAALVQIDEALSRVPGGQDATDLWLIGRVVAGVIDESARDSLARLENLKNFSAQGRGEQLRKAMAAIESGREHTGNMSYRYRRAVGAETAAAALADLHLLLREQARLVKTESAWAGDAVAVRRVAQAEPGGGPEQGGRGNSRYVRCFLLRLGRC